MENNAYMALGSNVGDRLLFIKNAIDFLSENPEVNILDISSLYETLPVGEQNQEKFINLVLKIQTTLNANNLFDLIKNIENEVGRTKTYKWGPREIDIDLLLFGDQILKSDKLTIPHPEMLQRDFVLVPLLEIEPDVVHPVHKLKVSELSDDKKKINILNKLPINTIESLAV